MAEYIIKHVCTAALVTPAEEIPMLERSKGRFEGLFGFPGGTVEMMPGREDFHSLQEHVAAEVREELAITIPADLFSAEGNTVLKRPDGSIAITRWIAPWNQEEKANINQDPDKDHAQVVFMNESSYRNYPLIPGIQEYLDTLFGIKLASGTLLAAISDYIRLQLFCLHETESRFLAIRKNTGKYIIPSTYLSVEGHLHNVILRSLRKTSRRKIRSCLGCWVDVTYIEKKSQHQLEDRTRTSDRPPQRLLEARYVLYSKLLSDRFPLLSPPPQNWRWFPFDLSKEMCGRHFHKGDMVYSVISRINNRLGQEKRKLQDSLPLQKMQISTDRIIAV